MNLKALFPICEIRAICGCILLFCLFVTAGAAEITTIAGVGQKGTAADGAIARESKIGEPYGLEVGPDGALYVCEIANHLLRRIDLKTGAMTVIAGSGTRGYSGDGGPATQAKCDEPYEVRFDSIGNMLFVEMKNAVVRKVDAKSGVISTIAGTGKNGFSGDGGPAIAAMLKQPHSIALDNDDNIYICDIGNHRVRRVDAKTNIISTFAGTGAKAATPDGAPISGTPLNGPRALDFDGKHTFALALREGNAIYRMDISANKLTHVAGTGKKGFTGHGEDARLALLSGPKGVAISPSGDIYFADTESHTVRVVRAKTGIIETVAGDGVRGDGPDGDPLRCRLARPHGVCLSPSGDLFIGDSENHRVRMLKVE